jgi:hypothetical protein
VHKLKLDVEALGVVSFDTGKAEGSGTVRGYSGSLCTVVGDESLDQECGGADYTVNCTPIYTCAVTYRCTELTYCNQASCVYTCGPQNTCQQPC